jgi:hypothetical protein
MKHPVVAAITEYTTRSCSHERGRKWIAGTKLFFPMHDISLITTIALGLSAALLFGILAKRIGHSPIVGYLAGVAIGPHTPGLVGDAKIAAQFAEIGVILRALLPRPTSSSPSLRRR